MPICLMTAALLAAGCTEIQPGLARDWAETKALRAARDDHGGYLAAADELMVRGEYELALRGYTRAIAEVGLTGPVIGGGCDRALGCWADLLLPPTPAGQGNRCTEPPTEGGAVPSEGDRRVCGCTEALD